jgi:hypothetical protein
MPVWMSIKAAGRSEVAVLKIARVSHSLPSGVSGVGGGQRQWQQQQDACEGGHVVGHCKVLVECCLLQGSWQPVK